MPRSLPAPSLAGHFLLKFLLARPGISQVKNVGDPTAGPGYSSAAPHSQFAPLVQSVQSADPEWRWLDCA